MGRISARVTFTSQAGMAAKGNLVGDLAVLFAYNIILMGKPNDAGKASLRT
jgi:hypothetical protein